MVITTVGKMHIGTNDVLNYVRCVATGESRQPPLRIKTKLFAQRLVFAVACACSRPFLLALAVAIGLTPVPRPQAPVIPQTSSAGACLQLLGPPASVPTGVSP